MSSGESEPANVAPWSIHCLDAYQTERQNALPRDFLAMELNGDPTERTWSFANVTNGSDRRATSSVPRWSAGSANEVYRPWPSMAQRG